MNKFTISLNSSQLKYTNEDPLYIDFTVTNDSDSVKDFSVYHTPFEGFMGPYFRVTNTDTGKKSQYIGKQVKRSSPKEDDFIKLRAGETKSIRINLKEGYKIETPGKYEVVYCPAFDINEAGCEITTSFQLEK